jgi:hypothetical protein
MRAYRSEAERCGGRVLGTFNLAAHNQLLQSGAARDGPPLSQ